MVLWLCSIYGTDVHFTTQVLPVTLILCHSKYGGKLWKNTVTR